ncbi:uncharacterized protein A4U43_C10F17190 [Asparagus officinalis]|uniref:Uncharacterized protein n=1 Tax=Asparagus officinalis TaxID=4686 RepID=A0A5P1E6P4_ASPOF|nr:uncharacterized protein LOC109825760 [Asparagus officinalis]ONK57157.1 uncharacterized protein A4U43_C10F17190 [Asparagus officinalis]
MDKEPDVSRHRTSNRVAMFHDCVVERKDPDFDRCYDRYMKIYDPGFGFSAGSYPVQPLFSPAVNYNTEFHNLVQAIGLKFALIRLTGLFLNKYMDMGLYNHRVLQLAMVPQTL